MHYFFELLLLAGLVALLIQLPAKFLAIALAIGAVVWFLLPGGLPGGFHFGIGWACAFRRWHAPRFRALRLSVPWFRRGTDSCTIDRGCLARLESFRAK